MAFKIQTLASINLTAAGTAQQLTSTLTKAEVVNITAKVGNTGNIYIGDSNVSSTRYFAYLDAGESVSIEAQAAGYSGTFDLSEIYIDGDTTNDDVLVGYIERQN